jgi:hypothetical protein
MPFFPVNNGFFAAPAGLAATAEAAFGNNRKLVH